MIHKKDSEETRMLKEMLETAQDLNARGVMSKLDMEKVHALCEAPNLAHEKDPKALPI